MRLIYALLVFGIVYGSLYPFNFNVPDSWGVLSEEFLGTLFAKTSRGDLLGNIALFIPLGIVARVILPAKARVSDLLLHACLALFVAVAVQVLQLALPSRDPALQDAAWNMLGWVIGLGIARLIIRLKPSEWHPERQQEWLVPIGLMMCWLAYDLFPYIPTLDYQGYKDALKPLLLDPVFRFDSFLKRVTAWLLFAAMMQYVVGVATARWLFPLISLMSVPAKVVIYQNSVNVHVVAAVLIANLAWMFVGRREKPPYLNLALLVLASIVVAGILPIDHDFRQAGSFYWIPFAGALQGSMVINFLATLEKVFLFGGFFWLIALAGGSLTPAIIMICMFVLPVEILQMYSPSRTAEITDVFLVLLIGLTMKTIGISRTIEHAQPVT